MNGNGARQRFARKDPSARLGEDHIPRLLLEFSLPAIVGMMAQALYNVIDRVFIGQAAGPQGIAGITVAFPFMLVQMALAMLIGFGGAALVSIRLGQQRREAAEQVLGNAAVLLVSAALLLTACGMPLLDQLLMVSGASPTVLPYARDYLQIIAAGTVFQLMGFGLNAIIRGEGHPGISMVTMLVSVAINLLLAPLFIFGFGWGMRGAALATVLAQAAAAIWVTVHFASGRGNLRFHLRHLRLDRSVCGAMLAIGSAPFVMQLAASVLNSLLNRQLREYGGDLAISAMGIIYAVVMMIIMPIFGINQGAQPIVGYNHGARRFDRVRRTLLTAILAASSLTVAGFTLTMLFPLQVVHLFERNDPALAALGGRALRISLLMLPVVGFQIVSASYFQAVGKPKPALVLSLSRQVLLLVPAVLVLPRLFGLDGVWAAMPVADFGSAVWTGLWLLGELRHLDQSHAETGQMPRPREPEEAGGPP